MTHKKLEDGTITNLPKVKVATHPASQRVEDTLLSREYLTSSETETLVDVLDYYIQKTT